MPSNFRYMFAYDFPPCNEQNNLHLLQYVEQESMKYTNPMIKLLILDLHIYRFSPLNGSSYILLPEKIAQRVVVNIQNTNIKMSSFGSDIWNVP